MVRTYMSWLAAGVLCLAMVAALWPSEAGSPAEREALREGRVIITYWDRHTGHEFEARKELLEEFNRSQDKVYVRTLPIGFTMEKLLTAIAGGAPPDICSMEGTILAALAYQDCLTPLTELMARCPHMQEDDYFPHAWATVAFEGEVWGVPTTTDTSALLWNRSAFRRAGLDPDRPPRDLDELGDFAARLTARSGTGIDQMGFLPWLPWDHTFMWGGLFGGTWYDKETRRFVCADDPAILRMFEWQRSFALDPADPAPPAYALDPERVAAFRSGFGAYQSANNPFYSGKVAMITEGEWQVTFIPRYAPELDWGAAPVPQPEGAPPRSYAASCVIDAIPAGSRHVEAAWAFLEWFNSPRPDGRPSPASDYNKAIHNIPCRPEDALHDRFMGDPKFSVFVNELLTKESINYPVTPATQFFLDELERQRELVVLRRTTPERAAREIQDKANAELDRLTAILERAGQ